jgi:hypothetical protein
VTTICRWCSMRKTSLVYSAAAFRNVQRLFRARELPDPLPIPGRPRWSRQVILAWLNGDPKNIRRGRSLR